MKVSTNKMVKKISDKVYSPLSIIFSLREKNLQKGDIYNYQTYSVGKLKDISISVIGEETINTPYGIYQTIIISPVSSNENPIMKNRGDMKIWLTNDEKRIPLKIEVKQKYGSISLLLNNIE